MKNRELAEWLGLTYAGMFGYLSLGAAIAMFFVHDSGLDILLAVIAVTLVLISWTIGMKRDSRISDFTNNLKLISYPLLVLVIALLIFFHYAILPSVASFTGVPKPYYIPSSAMSPTLQINDRILVDLGAYISRTPQRGDIIVFKPTEQMISEGQGRGVFVFRVIGLPGEKIEVSNGKTLINEKPIQEPYIVDRPTYQFSSILVPTNSYFVLGDNRNNSYDSHIWGFVPQANLLGRVNLIYWPPNRFGSPYK